MILVFGVAAVVLQTTLLPLAPIGSAIPDLVLVLTVYLGLYHQTVGGAVAAFFLGYFVDAFSGMDVGLNAFAMTFVFLVVYVLSRRLWFEGGLSNALVVLVSALVKTLVIAGLVAAFSRAVTATTVRDDILGGVLAAFVTPLVFDALRRAKGRVGATQ